MTDPAPVRPRSRASHLVDTPRRRIVARIRWLLLDPVGLCVLLPILALPPAWLHATGPLASVGVLTAFAVLHPALCVGRPPWWGHTIVGAVAFAVTLVAVGAAPAVERMREGAMIFLLPVTLYPAAAAVSAGVRVLLWLRTRGRDSA